MRPCPAASPPERFGGEGAPPRIGSDFVVHVVDGGVFGVREGFFRCVHDGPRVHAQMLDELALDGVAQLGGFIEQGTDLFLALAELFGPESSVALVPPDGIAARPASADTPGQSYAYEAVTLGVLAIFCYLLHSYRSSLAEAFKVVTMQLSIEKAFAEQTLFFRQFLTFRRCGASCWSADSPSATATCTDFTLCCP